MKRIIDNMAWVPFGFPLGWIACRAVDGKFAWALIDFVGLLALIGAMSLIGWLEDRPRPQS